jgi:hypothetical protein
LRKKIKDGGPSWSLLLLSDDRNLKVLFTIERGGPMKKIIVPTLVILAVLLCVSGCGKKIETKYENDAPPKSVIP